MRAGVLEQGTVDLMVESGVGGRLIREGLRHEGLFLKFEGNRHRINMAELTKGRCITVYAQSEVVRDLIDARHSAGGQILFEVGGLSVHDFNTEHPRIRFQKDGDELDLHCDFIAGCDGFHGVCRPTMGAALTTYDRAYPFAWLGILARRRHPRTNWCTHSTNAGSHCSACERRKSPGSIFRFPQTRIWPTGPTTAYGKS